MKQSSSSLRWASALLGLAALAMTGTAMAAKDAVLSIGYQPETLDPYNTNTTITTAVTKTFYEGLFQFDKDLKVQNVLAEGYEVSKDGLVYTIKLRQGVKFHDGTDFNAEAVKFTLDRVLNQENKLLRYNQFNRVGKVEALNPTTVRITLKEPFGPFINSLAHASAAMISPTALQKWGNKDIAFHPVGTGPFEFVEWKQTEAVKAKKFDGYWKKGYPKIDNLQWKPVLENNTRAAMLQTGEADFAFPIPYEQAELLKKSDKLEVVAIPSIITRFLAFNMLQKPYDNPKVREAIGYAINKEALAKVAFGRRSPCMTPTAMPRKNSRSVSVGSAPSNGASKAGVTLKPKSCGATVRPCVVPSRMMAAHPWRPRGSNSTTASRRLLPVSSGSKKGGPAPGTKTTEGPAGAGLEGHG